MVSRTLSGAAIAALAGAAMLALSERPLVRLHARFALA